METQLIGPHTKKEIKEFAEEIGISESQARFLDYLRGKYIAQEYDYIKGTKKKTKVTK